MDTVNIPAMFYDDHKERALPTPVEIRRRGRVVVVLINDPALSELLDDARYYADSYGPDILPQGLKASAKRTVEVIEKAQWP